MDGAIRVLHLAAEGGSVCIYRVQNGAGEWGYITNSGSIALDGDDRDFWTNAYGPFTTSFETAMDSIRQLGDWFQFFPLEIHPEYLKTIWFEYLRAKEEYNKRTEDMSYGPSETWQKFFEGNA